MVFVVYWKRLGKKILFPPKWGIVILTVFSGTALPLVLRKGWEQTPIAYAVYTVSFYALLTLCARLCTVFSGRYGKLKQRISNNPLGNRYVTDIAFKVKISLYLSLGITIAYSVFKLISGILYSSFWFCAVAVYYVLLSVIRFVLLRYMHKNNGAQDTVAEYQRYRLSAILMMLINVTLSGIVLTMIVQNKRYAYSDIYAIASAAYTFYILTVSVVDLVRYRKYQSPVLFAAKAARFAAALVSVLSLESVMLVQFGNDEAFRKAMMAWTGAGVCVIVLAMSIYMIVHANLEIKKQRSGLDGPKEKLSLSLFCKTAGGDRKDTK